MFYHGTPNINEKLMSPSGKIVVEPQKDIVCQEIYRVSVTRVMNAFAVEF